VRVGPYGQIVKTAEEPKPKLVVANAAE
jgi:hypothetical protein